MGTVAGAKHRARYPESAAADALNYWRAGHIVIGAAAHLRRCSKASSAGRNYETSKAGHRKGCASGKQGSALEAGVRHADLLPEFDDELWLSHRAYVWASSMRATAKRAFLKPDILASFMPHAFSVEKRWRGSKLAGARLPDPVLRSGDGIETRLYRLAPNAAFLVHVSDVPADAVPPSVLKDVIRIGEGAWLDETGLLRGMTGSREGWILVRPDLHVAWTGDDQAALCEIANHAMGARGDQNGRP